MNAGCFDPSFLLPNLCQKLISGQSLAFPAINSILIECTGNKVFGDGSLVKNISCLNQTWILHEACIGVFKSKQFNLL